ncbi:MAG: hypothetical protein U0935_06150 [Pirellulales bacterium]
MSRGCSCRLWLTIAGLVVLAVGCRGNQYARVIQPGQKEMIGSHQAGQETFQPLVEQTVAKLLARHEDGSAMHLVSAGGEPVPPPKMSICFVGVENKSGEEIGDFKDQLYELIDTQLLESTRFKPISRRYVQAGLEDLRLRPEQLFLPSHMQSFVHVMQQNGQPFDFLLYARLTSGTTRQNKDYQRDYLLTLELIDIRTGEQDKQSETISKGYHHSWASRAWSQGWPWGAK